MLMTAAEWAAVEGFISGTPDGITPHLTFRAWRYVCSVWEAALLAEHEITKLRGR